MRRVRGSRMAFLYARRLCRDGPGQGRAGHSKGLRPSPSNAAGMYGTAGGRARLLILKAGVSNFLQRIFGYFLGEFCGRGVAFSKGALVYFAVTRSNMATPIV